MAYLGGLRRSDRCGLWSDLRDREARRGSNRGPVLTSSVSAVPTSAARQPDPGMLVGLPGPVGHRVEGAYIDLFQAGAAGNVAAYESGDSLGIDPSECALTGEIAGKGDRGGLATVPNRGRGGRVPPQLRREGEPLRQERAGHPKGRGADPQERSRHRSELDGIAVPHRARPRRSRQLPYAQSRRRPGDEPGARRRKKSPRRITRRPPRASSTGRTKGCRTKARPPKSRSKNSSYCLFAPNAPTILDCSNIPAASTWSGP